MTYPLQDFVKLRALENERWEYVLSMGYYIPSPGYRVEELWTVDTDKHLITEIVERRRDTKLHSLSEQILALRNAMIIAHQPLVTRIARKTVKKEFGILSFEDFQVYGTFGLIIAINRFDVMRGLQFSTFAGPWIRSALFRAVQKLGATVRLPYRTGQLAKVASLEDEYAEDFTIGDTLAVPEPEDTAHHSGISVEEVHRALGQLSPKLQNVINERFRNKKSLRVIGKEYGLSRERIRQLERDALIQLRKELGVAL